MFQGGFRDVSVMCDGCLGDVLFWGFCRYVLRMFKTCYPGIFLGMLQECLGMGPGHVGDFSGMRFRSLRS